MSQTFTTRSENETEDVGRSLALQLPKSCAVFLFGDLGAGKTTLVRAMATALGADPLTVTSPSFALVHEYPLEQGPALVHIDGYRLSDRPMEWQQIGIPELLGAEGVRFVEWPKPGFEKLTDHIVRVDMAVMPDDSRTIVVTFGEGV